MNKNNNYGLSENDMRTVFGSRNQYYSGLVLGIIKIIILLVFVVSLIVSAVFYIDIKFILYEIAFVLFGLFVLFLYVKDTVKVIRLRKLFEAGKIKAPKGYK